MTLAVVILSLVLLMSIVMYVIDRSQQKRLTELHAEAEKVMRKARDEINAEFAQRRSNPDIAEEIRKARERDKKWPN